MAQASWAQPAAWCCVLRWQGLEQPGASRLCWDACARWAWLHARSHWLDRDCTTVEADMSALYKLPLIVGRRGVASRSFSGHESNMCGILVFILLKADPCLTGVLVLAHM